MMPARHRPVSDANPDDLQVVRVPLRRSWGILARFLSGLATPSTQNCPVTPRVVRNSMTRPVRLSVPIDK